MIRRALVVVFAFALALPAVAVSTQAPRVLQAGDKVEGKRVDAYPALWWQWANRKRWGAQPFQDPTGAQCQRNQHGAVWFLAGTDGSDIVHRRCRIPSGKHLFLPVITMLENAAPGAPRGCEAVKRKVLVNNEHVVASEISVDGRRFELAPLRMASGECFNAYAQADYLDDTSAYFPSATDGYWLMLAPLADGHHLIRINVRYEHRGAAYGDMEQVFDYELDVGGPEPAPESDDEDEDEDEDGRDWRDT